MRTYSLSSIVSRNSAEQVSVSLMIAVHQLELDLYDDNTNSYGLITSPTIIGVNKAIHDTINLFLKEVQKDVDNFLDNEKPITDVGKLEGASELHLEDIPLQDYNDVLLLYGVSGSGKTRSIEHLLHSHWGYYLLPGNVDPTEQRDRGNLYDPHREKYSKDSCVLWSLLRESDKIMPGMGISPDQVDRWFRRLLLSRHLIFDKFLEVAAKRQPMTPAKWLGYQKRRSGLDPFETLFKLLLLVNVGARDLEYKTPHLDPVIKEKPFYYCLDEAQRCLDTPLSFNNTDSYKASLRPFNNRWPYEDENILPLICTRILEGHNSYSRFHNRGVRFIVGGTSLKLKETISTIERIETIDCAVPFPNRKQKSNRCRTVTDFPLLTSEKDLRNLIKERGLLQKTNTDPALVEGLIKEVIQRGVPLRGRYLWSALYVDHLKEHFEEHGKLDNEAISEAADKAIDKAKRSLKERLSRLQEKKHNEILQELCRVVIQSDLLDMPTTFAKDEDRQMVSEAFAVVETEEGSPVGVLKERLAVEAAKEWFREEQWDMYSGKLKEYLCFSTNDASSFGKAAEWWLVLVRTDTHVRCNIC